MPAIDPAKGREFDFVTKRIIHHNIIYNTYNRRNMIYRIRILYCTRTGSSQLGHVTIIQGRPDGNVTVDFTAKHIVVFFFILYPYIQKKKNSWSGLKPQSRFDFIERPTYITNSINRLIS